MPRWMESRKIMEGPGRQDFLNTLIGIGTAFAIEPPLKETSSKARSETVKIIAVSIDRIERRNTVGTRFRFYGTMITDHGRRVRGLYDIQSRNGEIVFGPSKSQ